MGAPTYDLTASALFNLSGLIALVTGGGTGIGLMQAQALAANGAKGEMVPLQGDVTSKESIKNLVREMERREGRLHILVKSWSELSAEELSKMHFDNENYQDWSSLFDVNISSIFFSTMAFLPLLEKSTKSCQGWSSTVISTTSISGIVKASQQHFAYNASKAAANHLTRMLAHELSHSARIKLRVNAIAPGVFPSQMTEKADPGPDNKNTLEGMEMGIPAGRPGDDRDMAGAILFLATSQYTNGQIIAVDGGFTVNTASTA